MQQEDLLYKIILIIYRIIEIEISTLILSQVIQEQEVLIEQVVIEVIEAILHVEKESLKLIEVK